MASKYFAIEVSFADNNKWEQIGEKYPLMHKAVEHMESIDLTFPTRIVKVVKTVILAEKYERKAKVRKKK